MTHTPCTLCDASPTGLHLCDFRRGRTPLDLHGRAMKINDEPWRCLACLRTVGEDKILHYGVMGRFGDTLLHGTLGVVKMVTGYESMCCGGAGEPWPDFENTYEEE